ncbi:DNA polymerase I [Anseongella ginsenosidimutans]|uniref:DNA polymerase I n=2 Tax=Anseongella ginsenosidimutans TaxID=496056 RepID=A0A4V2UU53_9SPHI|nr:DNA polymerase I [Anseongella ginsenosidimutans]QEC51785.1 DNA polymerase I [Anseongella ginsenosidimutans]TCS89153.1 DNA polymerase I [Anseongella ginsenosidimutans]
MDKRLFLLDGMALAYRAYFALIRAPRMTSGGMNTSAVFGFANTILDLLKKEQPTHMAVVFDTQAPTDRHIGFEGYKANRQEMPEDLSVAMPYIFRLIEGFNIPVLTSDGFEADDIIGTLAKKAEKESFITYMVTPDKDFGQLVSDKIFIYKPGIRGGDVEIMGVQEILEKWSIDRVEQVIDILGLWGDAVDNIPGIPGIGEKTAKQLIKTYGSIENLIANSSQLKGKQKENVEAHAEQGLLSKRLATILLDAPVELDIEKLLIEEPDREKLEQLFAELEFRTLGKRVFGEEFTIAGGQALRTQQTDLFGNDVPAPPGGKSRAAGLNNKEALAAEADATAFAQAATLKTIEDTEHRYHLADSPETRAALVRLLEKQAAFCFDTETTGTDANNCELVGLSFCIEKGEAWYVPIPSDMEEAGRILNEFKPVLENERIRKIGQNLKFDIIVLRCCGVNVAGKLSDTMLAHYILEPDGRHGMDLLAGNYLAYKPVSITELIGKKGKAQGNMRDVVIETIKDYAAEDADITLQLKEVFDPLLEESGLRHLVEDIENPLIYVLAEMEREGVAIDKEGLALYSRELENDIKRLEESIYEYAGVKFNIASPRQLGDVLFEKLLLEPKPKKTKTGQYQTGEDILLRLATKHDIVQHILDFRQLQKLKSTYVDALPLMINPRTGRVHTSYNQAVAATGRLSSNNPNLQNIPIRTEKGREVRKAFIPRDKDHVLLSADYSQIELRIIAAISRDENMMQAFIDGMDIHTATAAKVYGISPEEVSSSQRRNAKAVNFGIIYGQSAFGLSQNLGISRTEAKEVIDAYFKQYPGIRQYMTDTVEFARSKGYVQTIMGRRRYLRDINSANATVRGFAERNAINAPIQGSAADMIKIAMLNIHRELNSSKLGTKMILQVHDELVFDVPRGEEEKVKTLVEEQMKNAMPLEVPVLVESGTGSTWLEAH